MIFLNTFRIVNLMWEIESLSSLLDPEKLAVRVAELEKRCSPS